MQKGLWKKALLVLLPIAVLIAFAFLDPDVADIGTAIKSVHPYWLLAAVASIFLYYYCDTLMYQLACKFMQAPQKTRESILTTMIGFFYSALTPFASGGQPLQVIQMRRRGIRVGVATSVLVLKFIAWQLVITLIGTVGLIVIPGEIFSKGVTMSVLVILGFLVHIGTVVVTLMAFLKPDWIYRAGRAILRFLERIKVLKNQQKIARVHTTWSNTIADYRAAMQFATRHKLGMLSIFFVAFAEAIAYMAVTYFIYRGLGLNTHNMIHVVLLQAMLYIAVSFIPIPGASIASEGGFYMMFSELFTPGARFPAVVMWRAITYYSALFLGLIAVVIDGLRKPIYPAGTPYNGGSEADANEFAQAADCEKSNVSERAGTNASENGEPQN